MIKKKIKEKNLFIFFLIFTIILLTTPLIIRSIKKNPVTIDIQPYYHLRIAREIVAEGNLNYDTLSYQGRNYIFDPYNYFLAFINKLFGNIFFFFSIILGITSVIIFYYLIKKLRLNLLTRFLIMLTLVLSPAFIYTFTVLNKHSLVISFFLLGFLLFIDKKPLLNILSIIIFGIIPFFNTLASLIVILLILCYTLYKDRKKKLKFYTTLALIVLVNILYNLNIYLKYSLPEKITFISVNYLQRLLSDLGSYCGLAFFNLILTIIGIIVTWKHKRKLWLVYITILILFISLSYFSYSTIYLKFIISIFAGIGFYSILSMKWKLKFIRNLSIFILILGLIFSTTSYISRIANSLPDKNIKESLEYLDVYSDPEEIILSHYSRGFWIEYFANRKVVMDSLFTYAPKPNERYQDSNAIFYGSNLQSTKELLDKYKINYIYIDNEMKHGLVWKKEKQGLLFLFRNNETFRNIYNENGIEIWYYKSTS